MTTQRAFGSVARLAVNLVSFGILAAPALTAHHSSAMFDHDRVVEISGVVKEFQWTNPHVWIQIDVETTDGRVEWSIEGGGPNSLSRQGWRPSTFRAGSRVTVKINPMLDGTPAGGFIGARFEDGSTLGRWE